MTGKYPDGAFKLADGMLVKDESFLADCHEKVKRFYLLWKERCARHPDDNLAGRADFDPVDMFDLLPHIFMVDIETETGDYRYRLIGTEEVAFRNFDPSGQLVKETCASASVESALACYDYVFKVKKPLYSYTTFDGLQHLMSDETLFLPIAGDGQNVDIALCIGVQNRA